MLPFCIFEILTYHTCNRILVLKQSDQFFFLSFCPQMDQKMPEYVKSKIIQSLQNQNLIMNMISKDSQNVKIIKKSQLEVGA